MGADGTYGTKTVYEQSEEEAAKNEVMFVMANLYKIVVAKAGEGRSDGTVRLTQCIRAMVASSGGKLEGNQLAAAQLTQAEWGSGHSRTQLAKVLELATTNSEWTLGAAANDDALFAERLAK